MTSLHVIASSSAGNAYALRSGRHILLIELGVEWKRILRAIDYRVSDISGAIVSHSHGDHLRPATLRAAQLSGIPVHGPDGIPDVSPLAHLRRFSIGPFTVTPLSVPHNVPCFAYRIEIPDVIGSILFITDASSFPYHVAGASHLIIETNHCASVIADLIARGSPIRSHPEFHMSLESAVKVAREHLSSPLRSIACVHLSHANSDPDLIVSTISSATSITPVIAAPGIDIYFPQPPAQQ